MGILSKRPHQKLELHSCTKFVILITGKKYIAKRKHISSVTIFSINYYVQVTVDYVQGSRPAVGGEPDYPEKTCCTVVIGNICLKSFSKIQNLKIYEIKIYVDFVFQNFWKNNNWSLITYFHLLGW